MVRTEYMMVVSVKMVMQHVSAYANHNSAELTFYYNKGLRAKNPPAREKRAIEAFRRTKVKLEKQLLRIREVEHTRSEVLKAANEAIREIKKKYQLKRGRATMQMIRIQAKCLTYTARMRRRIWREMNEARLDLAVAMGYRPLSPL